MDQLINLIVFVVATAATVVALLAAINLLLPEAIQKVHRNLENSLGRSTLLGLVNFLFLGVLIGLSVWLADTFGDIFGVIFGSLAVLIGIGMIILTFLGLVAFANLLGSRIGDDSSSPFKINLRGGVLLVLAGIAPYVGWLIFTPLVVWTGLGAAIQAFLPRRKVSVPVEE